MLLTAAAGCTGNDGEGARPASPTTPGDPATTTSTTTTATTPDSTTVRARRTPTGPFGRSALAVFADCPALRAHLVAEAQARVTPWGFGWGAWYGEPVLEGTMAAADTAEGAAPTAAGAPAYSTTNTQEVGVDEGDVVETDGRSVFTAGPDELRIVDVAGATVVAEAELPQGAHQLILHDQRLLVATQQWSAPEDTVVSVFDVRDPAAPALLRRSHLEGRLVATRASDGTARLVLAATLGARLPFVQPTAFGLDEERALARNRELIEQSTIEDWLPRRFDESPDGSFGEIEVALDCADVSAPPMFSGLGISWIASIDLVGDPAPVGSAGIVSTGETVYASPTSLYVATVPWDWYHPADGSMPAPEQQPPTAIHAFELDADRATYVASGEVPGRLLGQFAMSEHEGVLRVASTTDAWALGGESESAVHVLRRDGGTLAEIGRVAGLGRGEQIHAVRFLGDTGYVVTFRQVDPLYVIDLRDPAAPALAGELKIPGYSAYLHPVGEGLLLGVGQDATDEGRTLGTQLSLFDVSDPAAPQRIATLPIGGWSEAEWDHHAFLHWPEDGTVVLPASPGWGSCGPAVDCLAGRITTPAGGAVVARVADRSLEAVGVIAHEALRDDGCWSPLQRSLVIGDELVTVGSDQLVVSDRTDLGRRAVVPLGDGEDAGCWGYWD